MLAALVGWKAASEKEAVKSLSGNTFAPAKNVSKAMKESDQVNLASESMTTWPSSVPASGVALRKWALALLLGKDPLQCSAEFSQLMQAANGEQAMILGEAWREARESGVIRLEVADAMNYGLGLKAGKAILGSRQGSDYDLSVAKGLQMQLRGWVAGDVEEARQWVNALPDGAFRDRMVATYVGALGMRNLQESVDLMATLPPELQRSAASQLAETRHGQWLPAEALDWLSSVPVDEHGSPPSWAGHVYEAVVNQGFLSNKSAPAVAAALERHVMSSLVRAEDLARTAKTLGETQPVEAMEWARRVEAAVPDKTSGSTLLTKVIEGAMPDQLPAVATWLAGHPDLPGRETVVHTLLERMGTETPDDVEVIRQRLKP